MGTLYESLGKPKKNSSPATKALVAGQQKKIFFLRLPLATPTYGRDSSHINKFCPLTAL